MGDLTPCRSGSCIFCCRRDKKALEEKAAKKAAQASGSAAGSSTDTKNKDAKK
jgi:hypothetical protein